MQREFNTLLIPVESQVRELDGKLLLACMAAENGFNCIIGSRAHIHFYASKVKDAIYLAKSMRRFSNRMFKILHGLGHRIVAWDEEALVRLPDEQYYTHRLSPVTFKYIDHLFSWGESDAQVFRNYEFYLHQPIHKVGNPRVDILRPEFRDYFQHEKNDLANKYGNYILINTNFGQVNHFIPDVGEQEANRDKNFSKDITDGFISQRYTHKQSLFRSFMQLVPFLAKNFPDTHFVLRPHPSENIVSWTKHLESFDNVTVCNHGNVIPWIMGAKALISNGCTTSIEATLLGKATLGYYPIKNTQIDDKLPKELSDIAQSSVDIAAKLSDILSDKYVLNENRISVLADHISNLTGDLCTQKIVDVLIDNYTKTDYLHKNTFTRLPSMIHNNTRTIVKRAKSHKTSSRNSIEYHKHRFPKIDLDSLSERIERFQSLTNKFNNIKVAKLTNDVYMLTK